MTKVSWCKLSELHAGKKGVVRQVVTQGHRSDLVVMARRLVEMGVIEGESFEVLHEGPVAKDPMSICIRGSQIALRRELASLVWVEEEV